ncbi:L-proline dehydrogenase /delta-1-pyrroline-5-carboxylate dehydrogenase [Arenicella xantha]|uniref:Bifunctional protein PutA n=2 Tax=Arenicella xantha TaxID=644221 RepID=A0A395JRS2_9GAMM|nr:L-proline dehydrogenase /delta-1-pyrroline-5-carboxylate dehydrogenase [Arenicella xantha]
MSMSNGLAEREQTDPTQSAELAALRKAIAATKHVDEHRFVSDLIDKPVLNEAQRKNVTEHAQTLVRACRKDTNSQTLLDSFLQEFGLSNKEGVALMCLAEALLRVPDKTTADRLIAEKITSGDWRSHNGRSESLFVNAATWGMILTGKLIKLDEEITQQPGSWLKTLSSNLSEPVVRRAILQAMRIMGGQYVLGRSIEEGARKGAKYNSVDTRYSFDMLGEAARTEHDAERYYQAYSNSIDRIGALNKQSDVYTSDGISVKLSALHPQYHFAHYQTVMDELLPKITELCRKAKHYNIGISIDAEEASRLEMSIDLFEALCRHPDLQQWDGLGFVMQAYQKRAPALANWLIAIGRDTNRKIMVRLVKGAYWDAEIKHAQEQGLPDYPVFTRKVNTDACYMTCAKSLLEAKDTIFPQFATHNAYTAVAILGISDAAGNRNFEFQRLHGMGELLYKHLLKSSAAKDIPLRVYAPIGQHEDLLPYLVRRLLENGANSSFVNRFLDDDTPVIELIQDVYQDVASHPQYRHSKIPVPSNLFIAAGEARINARGIDLDDAQSVSQVTEAMERVAQQTIEAHSIINGRSTPAEPVNIFNPANIKQVVGHSSYANATMIETALSSADKFQPDWRSKPAIERATVLEKTADLLEQNMLELMGIISLEAGRTIPDCVSEVREAIDFCRYYAMQATQGSLSQSDAQGRGVFFCISPWNFPLAIFVGQISAALVAGNCVLAKPAEQTPLVAARAVELFLQAGCPPQALQLILGEGAFVGGLLTSDPRIQGVAFTGSTLTAQRINQTIATRSGGTIPIIAETGGQNCMIVDSTALPEQVVDDVISSAFHSAGQRCSALRVLFLQDVIADKVLTMLEGAMQAVRVDDPAKLSADIGPVIDQPAYAALQTHIDYIAPLSRQHYRVEVSPELLEKGLFFQPQVFEIDSLNQLDHEVFGPVLHVIRYNIKDISSVIEQINATGYGLTLGVHSRISAFADFVYRNTRVGNTYINRNTIGAMVGVNPFGGKGLSGTGPKAGGPNYLHRFQRQTDTRDIPAKLAHIHRAFSAVEPNQDDKTAIARALSSQKTWSRLASNERCAKLLAALTKTDTEQTITASKIIKRINTDLHDQQILPGPTGEENILFCGARGLVLIPVHDALSATDLTAMLSIIVATGNTVLLHTSSSSSRAMVESIRVLIGAAMPSGVLQLSEAENLGSLLAHTDISAIVASTSFPDIQAVRKLLADRTGPITQLIEFDSSVSNPNRSSNYVSFLIDERTKTDNLVARGGNTQLFNLTEA